MDERKHIAVKNKFELIYQSSIYTYLKVLHFSIANVGFVTSEQCFFLTIFSV